MAASGIRISALPPIVTPTLTDVFPVSQNGVTYKETITQLFALFQADFIFTWQTVTADQIMLPNYGYFTNSASLVSLQLPAVSTVGQQISIAGQGTGGWKITQSSGQSISISPSVTTVGMGGSLASTNQYDSITLVCSVANIMWTVVGGPQSDGLTIV